MTIAIGGYSGGIPVSIVDVMGAIVPVKSAYLGVRKYAPIDNGMNIGKNIDPSPTRWNNTGSTTAHAVLIAAIMIWLMLKSSCMCSEFIFVRFFLKNVFILAFA